MNVLGTAYLSLGSVTLQSGETLTDCKLAYATLGSLNHARDNAVVMPTYYTGRHDSYLPLIGRGRALDPARYFIIIPNMLGNGVSSSPSTRGHRSSADMFPRVTIHDNVCLQARLVFEHLNVQQVALVCGWSLGGVQAFQWGVSYPDRVHRLLPFGTAARVSPYNVIFLEGLKATLQADALWGDPRQVPEKGLRAFARVYAGWAYCHEFFGKELYRELGYDSIHALFDGWEQEHLQLDARDLMAMLETWKCADVSANALHCGNFNAALRAIQARTMLVSCSTDRYFAQQDNEHEAAVIADCELRVLESPFGHCAFSPGRVPSAMRHLEHCLRDLLER